MREMEVRIHATYPLFLHVSHFNKLVQAQNSTNAMLEQWT
jgi:hypothetical protein